MKKKKLKVKSPTWYRKKLVDRAKIIAKERDGWACQYCGRTKAQGWQIHGSHILSEGSYPLMSVESTNIIALCATHHTGRGGSEPSWHEDPLDFSEWFESRYPGKMKELRAMAEEKKKHVVNWQKRYEEL